MSLPRITSKRRLVQAGLIATALLLPFATLGGNPFLRMDISMRTLFMAGVPVRIDQFYLVLLATLFIAVFFLLLTVILGRVWCGWLCPQTVFNDLAELIDDRFRNQVSPRVSRLIEHASAVLVSALISFNLFCWFMAPARVAATLLEFTANPLLAACFLLVSLLRLPQPNSCQTQLLPQLLPLRKIPGGPDRRGNPEPGFSGGNPRPLSALQRLRSQLSDGDRYPRWDSRSNASIAVAASMPAEGSWSGVRTELGLIDYRFGTVKGTRFRLGSKTILLGVVTLILGVGLIWGLVGRNQAAFALQRIATAEPRTMPDGFQAQPWRAIIGNRSESPVKYSIRVVTIPADDISLLGPVA